MASVKTKTRVVHVKDNVPGAVYIGRAVPRQNMQMSWFANPYRIGANHILDGECLSREQAVSYFRHELRFGILQHLQKRLPELVGKPLACWCRHDGEERTEANVCHGDALIEMIHELGLEEPDEQS